MRQRHYLVTGGTSGLGFAVARTLAERGVHLHVWARRINDSAHDVLNAACIDSIVFSQAMDFTAAADNITDNIVRTAEVHGGFDGIFHAAGEALVKPLRMTTAAEYRRYMVAAESAFAILRAAAHPTVMRPNSSIVLMSSVAAHRGTPGMLAYTACKSAIEGMTRVAAVELAQRGVRVNAVAAGAFNSPMHDGIKARMPKASIDQYALAHPLGIGDVEAVRDAVLYLLGDASRWVTGTVHVVDGGFLAK